MSSVETNSAGFLPNLILAGAPKCGTTSIFDYLRDHPDICAATVKETYFMMDLDYSLARDSSIHVNGLQGYKKYFPHCSDFKNKLRFEATPDYLYQNTPIESLPDWPVKPKVFFMLRRPEDRVYSLYRFAQHNMAKLSKSISFSEFIELVDSGDLLRRGRLVQGNAIEHSKYIIYLERWCSVLDEEQIGLFLFEDLVKSPEEFMTRLSHFLEIDPIFYSDYRYEISNRSFRTRSQTMHRAKKLLSRALPGGTYRKGLSKLYGKINIARHARPSSDDAEQLKKLGERFAKYNKELEQRFGIDLSAWVDNT